MRRTVLRRPACKAFIGLYMRAKMIGVGPPLLRQNLAETDPPPCKTPTSNQYSLVAPQPLAKIVQLTRIGSPIRAFQ